MKKCLALLTVILAVTGAGGQSIPASQSRVAGRFVAYNYGLWNTYPASISPTTGSQTFTVINSYVNLGDGRLISPFSTNAPLRIGTETVTPSAVANCFVNDVRVGVCQITVTFTLKHTNSDKISSATFGLQEALNDAGNSGGGPVAVDSAWAGAGGTTDILNAAVIPANTSIEDVRNGTAVGSGTVSGQTNGKIPLATGSTVIGAPSALDDGVTTPSTITSTEPIAAPSAAFSGNVTAGTAVAGQIQGAYQADQHQTGGGNNGIANSVTALGGAPGMVVAPPSYGLTEIPQGVGDNQDQYALTWPANTGVLDWRDGMFNKYCSDPKSFLDSFKYCSYELTTFKSVNPSGTHFNVRDWQDRFFDGGNNMFANIGPWTGFSWPGGRAKSSFNSMLFRDYKYAQGQYNPISASTQVNGIGDSPQLALYMSCSGGSLNDADEACGHLDIQGGEDAVVYIGTVTGSPSVGATTVQTTATSGTKTQGAGRYLLVTSSGTTTGNLTSAVNPVEQDLSTDCTTAANYTAASCIPGQLVGSGFSASTFIGLTQGFVNPSSNQPPAPGSQTVIIAPMSGFALASLAPGDFICVADSEFYEVTTITSINTSTGSMVATFGKPHPTGSMVAKGGNCGQFIDVNAYDVTSGKSAVSQTAITNPIHHVFPVVGTKADGTAVYIYNRDYISNGFASPQWGVNTCIAITTATRAANTVTATLASPTPWLWSNVILPITSMVDSTFNNSAQKVFSSTVTPGANTVLTYSNTGANATSSGGQICFTNNGYTLYNGAEVQSVFNPSTQAADGYFSLSPNNVTWSGATVEEPHGFNHPIPWNGSAGPSIAFSHFQVPARHWGFGVATWGIADGFGVGMQITDVQSNLTVLQNHGGFLPAMAGYELNGIYSSGYASQYFPESFSNLPADRYEVPGSLLYSGCPFLGCGTPNFLGHIIATKSTSGTNFLDYDFPSQTFALINASGRNFQLGNVLYLAGVRNLFSLTGMAVGGAEGNAIGMDFVIAPNGNPAADGSTNKTSNKSHLLGAFGDGTNVQVGGISRQIAMGAGTTPTVTENDVCETSGSVGLCKVDASTIGEYDLPATTKVGGSLALTAASLTRIAYGACTGVATSNTTIGLIGLGNVTGACTLGVNGNTIFGPVMPTVGTLKNLTVRCGTTGVAADSGIFTVWIVASGSAMGGSGSGTNTGLTVTYGTTTAATVVQDLTHTYTYAVGDMLRVQFATHSTGETIGSCTASVQY